jgi:hypothetical protein
MSQPALGLIFKMVYFSKGILIKMLIKSKNG